MSRKKFIAGNWKLHMGQEETQNFIQDFLQLQIPENREVFLCPTYTSLAIAKSLSKNSKIKIAAQNLSQYSTGAFTGEVSASMLKELDIEGVIIGHSERREIFKESDDIINAKIKSALDADLRVIFCCGESQNTRENGDTDTWIKNQIQSGLNGITSINNIVIAYEPIWAIGTGKTCDSAEANRVIKLIRNTVLELYDKTSAEKILILYGGSVKSSNASELFSQSDIDGALVGGSSLKVEEFSKIVQS